MNTIHELLTLALAGADPRRLRELLAREPLAGVLAAPDRHADLLGSRSRMLLRSGQACRAAQAEAKRAAAAGVRLVGIDDPEYPTHLRHIFDPPAVLWTRGRLAAEEGDRSVAIVGARAASRDGLALARGLGRELGRAGLTVVSGLARGIDTAAHEGALEAGGRSVAVLGSGLLALYPRENAALAQALAEQGGAVVSELALAQGARPENFPRRNRLIAGWSRAVVVVEAGSRSGALITARCALDEGRDVLAVPGHPFSTCSAGANALIRDGARLVRGAADVLEELGLEALPGPASAGSGLLEALEPDVPRALTELQRATGREIGELLSELGVLELENRVRRLPGGAFVRA